MPSRSPARRRAVRPAGTRSGSDRRGACRRHPHAKDTLAGAYTPLDSAAATTLAAMLPPARPAAASRRPPPALAVHAEVRELPRRQRGRPDAGGRCAQPAGRQLHGRAGAAGGDRRPPGHAQGPAGRQRRGRDRGLHRRPGAADDRPAASTRQRGAGGGDGSRPHHPRPQPGADRAAGHGRGRGAGAPGRADHRHRADAALGPALRPPARDHGAHDLLPGRAGRGPGHAASGCSTTRCRCPLATRGDRGWSRPRPPRQRLHQRRALRRPPERGGAGVRPPLPAGADRGRATWPTGCTSRPPSWWWSASRRELDELAARLRAQYDGRLFIVKSLPDFLEVAQPGVSQGQRPALRLRAAGHRDRPR